MPRGFFAIGIYNGKATLNVGTLWRSAYQLGAAYIFTIGQRYPPQASDTIKSWRHVPLFEYPTFGEFIALLPKECEVVGVEIGGAPLADFHHPQQCIYLLGAEDDGLGKEALDVCDRVVEIPSLRNACYNVAVAGSLIMYDRLINQKEVSNA
jgi:tRNA G18 (ribose-2'-O)-methylase SpoU